MNPQPRKFDDDDGRVICSMDVQGMPWQQKAPRREKADLPSAPNGQMTRSEARRFTWYAVKAGLLVATIFSVVWVLFILFCTQIWFR